MFCWAKTYPDNNKPGIYYKPQWEPQPYVLTGDTAVLNSFSDSQYTIAYQHKKAVLRHYIQVEFASAR